MIKTEKGITLAALIIVVILMTMISALVVNLSLDRFEINKLQRMYSDIELLQDKVANYYLKYGVLPVIINNNNKVTYGATLEFEKNSLDNDIYYIVNLEAMDGITLNYGKKGFEKPNESDDVYIINEKSHIIYYVQGIELKGNMYHTLLSNSTINDEIPPSKPQINVISGENISGVYTTDVEIEIVAGKDGGSGVAKTTYTIKKDGVETKNEFKENRTVISLSDKGSYDIKVQTWDNAEKCSETQLIIYISKVSIGSYVNYDISYTDMYQETEFKGAENAWRYLGEDANKNKLIISTGIPVILHFVNDESQTNTYKGAEKWWANTASQANERAAEGLLNNFSRIPYTKKENGTQVSDAVNSAIGRFDAITIIEEDGTAFNAIERTFWSSTYSLKIDDITIDNIENVRTLKEDELNEAVNKVLGTSDTSPDFRNLSGDAIGLFNLKDVYGEGYESYSYWLATTKSDGLAMVSGNSNNTVSIEAGNGVSSGIRPVIVLKNIELVDTNVDGVLDIIQK